ncbi:Tip elongation aberrant protein 3 [Colletotrichum orbiculare MAFF 240422]|uniref:Tip elongation aberrant protein 3 n=2 Tax=Colletotrichum orbiculare species complex TaxID=2707354 RepID=N4VH23_COLOR|nr:Tip elongation aberrant protein 3 [Colletotrichum orbiculare MAFF 240422]TDZ36219.1 Tip elongation aberrant protein 3 [Colletotrichum spinosum]
MAEAVAGAVVAEQIVSTGLQVGAAASVARSTQPLKVSLSQIATTPQDDASLSLARSHHSVTVINHKACIFGGETADGELCTTDFHVLSLPAVTNGEPVAAYACYPAFAMQDAETGQTYVPSPRTRHASCARGQFTIIHGGADGSGNPIDETCLWLWDSESLKWTRMEAVSQIGKTLAPRFDHHIFVDHAQDVLVLHGGRTAKGQKASTETWLYNFDTLAWTELPASPEPPTAAAFVDNVLYTIGTDSDMSGGIHYLDLKSNATDREKPNALEWKTVNFPTNPLVPGPRPREGGALVPVDTGVGRHYLIYMFGKDDASSGIDFHADIWALQLPSHGFTAAALKDAIRDKLPRVDSGEFSWAEVELVPTEEVKSEGKAHPGPRGFIGAGAADAKSVVFWGGVSAKGKEGDGWLLQVR